MAEPVERELADGMIAHLVGLQRPIDGPDDRSGGRRPGTDLRHQYRLPEGTTVHWHGLILPSGMDGVSGLSHPSIPPGKDVRL